MWLVATENFWNPNSASSQSQSWARGWKWEQQKAWPGCWIPCSTGVWSSVLFLIVSNRKHSNGIFLLVTCPKLGGLELIKEVQYFWFEQMNPWVASVGHGFLEAAVSSVWEGFPPPLLTADQAAQRVLSLWWMGASAWAASPPSEPHSHVTPLHSALMLTET